MVISIAAIALLTLAAFAPAGQSASADEQELRDIQQRLARAWVQKDRSTIEAILAAEWSVIPADGSVLQRAEVLDSVFVKGTFDIEHIDVGDLTVRLYGTSAVVRGQTVGQGRIGGQPVSSRIRFTDVFVKRDGRWQAVASQATTLPAQ